jgi:hypothetical protein
VLLSVKKYPDEQSEQIEAERQVMQLLTLHAEHWLF